MVVETTCVGVHEILLSPRYLIWNFNRYVLAPTTIMVLRQGKQNIAFTQYIATVVRNSIVRVLASGIAGLLIDLTLPRHLIVSK